MAVDYAEVESNSVADDVISVILFAKSILKWFIYARVLRLDS